MLVVGQHLRHGEFVNALTELPLAVLAARTAGICRGFKLVPQDLSTLNTAVLTGDNLSIGRACAFDQFPGVFVHIALDACNAGAGKDKVILEFEFNALATSSPHPP